MKISTRGRYALEAVLDLVANSGSGHESLRNVAVRRNISENYLEQIFIDLRKHHIVNSIRGARGGYMLSRDPSCITCGEIIRATEKKASPVACVALGDNITLCKMSGKCPTRWFWQKMMNDINEVADSVSIADLALNLAHSREGYTSEYFI